jgi:putative GTP pyrophosphokinase
VKELYEDLKNQYDRAISDNEKYCGELSNQIKAILRKSDLKNGAYTVEQRVKSWDSIFNNLTADRGSYRSMRDVSDLVGVRVVFLFKKDVENFCVDLREKFEIVKEEDKKSFLSADQFGYSSIHFLIKPPQSWREVPSFESFCDLTAEIQVRTAAQHIWANVSHLLNYKQKTQIPEPVLRVLNRSSALLEVIDNEFSLLLEKKDEYLISIK